MDAAAPCPPAIAPEPAKHPLRLIRVTVNGLAALLRNSRNATKAIVGGQSCRPMSAPPGNFQARLRLTGAIASGLGVRAQLTFRLAALSLRSMRWACRIGAQHGRCACYVHPTLGLAGRT